MHDPMTQAFEIRQFWRRPNQWGFKPPLVTIWHVDPERDGSDDSCDWWGRRLTEREEEFAASLIDNETGNLRYMFSTFIPVPCGIGHTDREQCYGNNCKLGEFVENMDRDEMKSKIRSIVRCYKREFRWWRYPVRWHFWHWKIQIHPLQNFKRWAFSRCSKCGRGFAWGYSPVTNSWDSGGPRWFRSERGTFHADCDRPTDSCCAATEVSKSLQ
jgi:hypothetical protein